jgi:hypothetical protein
MKSKYLSDKIKQNRKGDCKSLPADMATNLKYTQLFCE